MAAPVQAEREVVVCHLCQAKVPERRPDLTVNGYALYDHLLDRHRWWFQLPDPPT